LTQHLTLLSVIPPKKRAAFVIPAFPEGCSFFCFAQTLIGRSTG